MFELTGFLHTFPNNESIGVLTTQMKVKDLLDVYQIEDSVNRDINQSRVAQLSKYVDTFDSPSGIYFPAVIVAYEGADPHYDKTKDMFIFPQGRNFVVLDGQHRLKGLEHFKNTEKDMNRLSQILNSTITTQVYFGFDRSKKRRLFTEINATSKRVSKNLVVQYDDRNIVNTLVNDLLKGERNNPLRQMEVDEEKSRIVRPGNKAWMSSVRLARFISYLLIGTGEISRTTNQLLGEHYEKVFAFLQQYFYLLKEALPEEPGDVHKNILGHEALQNAIAVVCHERIVQVTKTTIEWKEDWQQVVEFLEYIDWNVNSPVFKSLLVPKGGKNSYVGFEDVKHGDVVTLLRRELDELLQDEIKVVYEIN
ncbi:DGQHR domain-containing protein [Bacillus sp. FJAT-52991]|uniref:DGQHR domain-containing protein n=1 Tax=Bacillus kandeliae TaxID=3129297 RepID=A0ABZ2N8B3_9BACI